MFLFQIYVKNSGIIFPDSSHQLDSAFTAKENLQRFKFADVLTN